jgi:hypothetical protein
MLEVTIGIDVGKEGGISILSKDGSELYDAFSIALESKDIVDSFKQLHTKYIILHCYIEKQAYMNRSYGSNPFARQGGKSAFTLGYSQGLIEGALLALGISYTLVPPKTWQKVIEDVVIPLDTKISNKKLKDTKVKSYLKVKELFPKAPLMTPRGKVLDGIADAILIAHWGASLCYDKGEKPKEQKRRTNDKSKSSN